MNNDIYFGKNSLRFWYFRYKDSPHYTLSVILIIIVTCSLLIFGFIIPQIDKWLSIRAEIEATSARTAIINDNIRYMNYLNRADLQTSSNVLITALPNERKYGEILNAISAASARSGVSFQDYSFQVGDVASTSGQLKTTNIRGVSVVNITLTVNSTVDQVRSFLRELQKTLPLSQVTSVDGSTGSITVSLEFYQKMLPPTSLQDTQPIPRVLETEKTKIDQLKSWLNTQNEASILRPEGKTDTNIPLF